MDHGRFDTLARSLAAPKTRRGLIGSLAALAVGARAASAQDPCPIAGQTRNRKGDCTCPPGQGDVCPGIGCTNRRSDPSNCGSCGSVCGAGEVCQKGECRCPRGAVCCPLGTQLCAYGSCASTDNPTDCGCAHERCPVNEVCSGGVCLCPGFLGSVWPSSCCTAVGDGLGMCGDEIFYSNPNTCGFVEACPTGYTPCDGSECTACCPPGTTCDPLGFCRQ